MSDPTDDRKPPKIHNVQVTTGLPRDVVEAIVECLLLARPPICQKTKIEVGPPKRRRGPRRRKHRPHAELTGCPSVCLLYRHPSDSLCICRLRWVNSVYIYTFPATTSARRTTPTDWGSTCSVQITGLSRANEARRAIHLLLYTFTIPLPSKIARSSAVRVNSITASGRLGCVLKNSGRPPKSPELFSSWRTNRETFPGSFYILRGGGCVCLFKNGSYTASGFRDERDIRDMESFIGAHIIDLPGPIDPPAVDDGALRS